MRSVIFLTAILLLFGCTVNPQDLTKGNQNYSVVPYQTTDQNQTSGLGDNQATQNQTNALTVEEVAKHNTAQDCWMVIGDIVLNLSSFVSHPGGSTYVPFCGTNATEAFSTKGGTGTNHSEYAYSMLNQYAIGTIGSTVPDTQPVTPPIEETLEQNASEANQTMLTMEEVAKHNSANDCWMVIRGSVLDLTSFSNHPGGSTYVPFCGTDATNAFDTKGGNGNPHSSYANSLLASFTIGQLGQPQDRNITNSTIPISGDDEDEYEEEYEDD